MYLMASVWGQSIFLLSPKYGLLRNIEYDEMPEFHFLQERQKLTNDNLAHGIGLNIHSDANLEIVL